MVSEKLVGVRDRGRLYIYLLVLLALALPILFKLTLTPARMRSAESFYSYIQELQHKPGELVLVALDYGPSLKAENGSQAEVVIEHLMRRRIPFAVMSINVEAEPFLKSMPELVARKLHQQDTSQQWVYGRDWVNLGFRPGRFLVIQSMAQSDDLVTFLKKDSYGTALSSLPIMQGFKTINNMPLAVQITGGVGVLDSYLRFLRKGEYQPKLLHGCTSITIPEAYIYLDSKQLSGLLEGIAGAAWYSNLLSQTYPGRTVDNALIMNTSLGVAHLVIIALIALGNIIEVVRRML